MQIEVLDNFFCKLMLLTIIGNCDNWLYYESLQILFLQLLQFLVAAIFFGQIWQIMASDNLFSKLTNFCSGHLFCILYRCLVSDIYFLKLADSPSEHIFANCRSGQLFVCPSPLSNIFYSFSFSPPLTKYFTSSNGLPLADDQCVHWNTHSLSPPPPPYFVSVLFS